MNLIEFALEFDSNQFNFTQKNVKTKENLVSKQRQHACEPDLSGLAGPLHLPLRELAVAPHKTWKTELLYFFCVVSSKLIYNLIYHCLLNCIRSNFKSSLASGA